MTRRRTKSDAVVLAVSCYGLVACSAWRGTVDIVTAVSIPILIIGASAFLKPRPDKPPPKTVHYVKNICVFGSQDAWSEDWSAAIAMDAVGKAIRLRKVVRPEATYVDISVEGRKVCRAPYDHTVQPLIDSQDDVDEHYRVAKDPLPEQLQSTLPPLPEEAKEGIRIEGNVVSTIGDDVPPVNAASIIAMRHRPLRIWVSTKEGVQRIEPDDFEEELAAVLLRHPGFSDRKRF